MLYHQYLINRTKWQKLIKKLYEKKNREDSSVSIQDLVAYPTHLKALYGEARHNINPYGSKVDVISRLIDHITYLSQLANRYHEQAYCEATSENGYQVKKECHNQITRLSLPEFSLYSKEPLTLAQFADIVENLESLAQKMHDNVHLLLSSFSVMSSKGENLNVTLYVQGGKPPKIDTIVKGFSSVVDITYKNATNFSQQNQLDLNIGIRDPISAYTVDEHSDGNTISNNSIIEIETKGGAKFIQAIDICLDHAFKHSKRLLSNQLEQDIDYRHCVPEQVDHIVTSNSIELIDSSKISPSILHVDTDPKYFDKENKKRPINNKPIKPVEPISNYSDMKILCKPGKITVINPPFGSSYRLIAYKERRLGGFIKELDAKVKELNKRIIAKQIHTLLLAEEKLTLKEFLSIEKHSIDAYSEAAMLLDRLSQKCKPNFFEYLFKTKNYFLKVQITAMLEDAKVTLADLKTHDAETLINAHVWAKDIRFKLNLMNNDFPDKLIQEIQHSIDTFQGGLELPQEWSNALL